MPSFWTNLTFISSGEATILVAVMTGVVRVIWSATSVALRWFHFVTSARVETSSLDLGPYNDFAGVETVRCLIVRYGSDDYLLTLASEQDRWEGRLQNRPIPVRTRVEGNRVFARVGIPVHKRLGTQFICMIDAKDLETAQRLAANPQLACVDPDNAANVLRPRIQGKRVFFLLPGIPVVSAGGTKTVSGEGIKNNISMPY